MSIHALRAGSFAVPHRDPFGAVTLAMSRRSQLEGRLLSILQPHIRRASASRKATLMAIALGMLLVIPLASLQLTAEPSPGKAPSTTVTVIEERDHGDHDVQVNADEDAGHLVMLGVMVGVLIGIDLHVMIAVVASTSKAIGTSAATSSCATTSTRRPSPPTRRPSSSAISPARRPTTPAAPTRCRTTTTTRWSGCRRRCSSASTMPTST